MKALFYSHTGQVSGAEVMLLLFLKHIDLDRFKPVVVCPSNGGLASKVREIGIEHRSLSELKARFTWNPLSIARHLSSLLRTIREFRSRVQEIEPELIHANSVRAGLAATLATVGTTVPVFWHIQDELKFHPFSTAVRLVILMSARVRMIPVSAATAKSFRGILIPLFGRRIPERVIHNAIDLERFRRDEKKRSETRSSLSLSDSEFVFGIVGQITPRKGQLELVKAFSEISSSQARLLIVGEPLFNSDHDFLAAVKDEIKSGGLESRVQLLGPRNDIPNIMRCLDSLVVNSKSEAFVVVGIESMAAGTPVIATDVGGIREMITHRESGLLVPFGDRAELVAAMTEMMHNAELRCSISRNAERFARERLSATTFVSEIERFLIEDHSGKNKKAVLIRPGSAESNV